MLTRNRHMRGFELEFGAKPSRGIKRPAERESDSCAEERNGDPSERFTRPLKRARISRGGEHVLELKVSTAKGTTGEGSGAGQAAAEIVAGNAAEDFVEVSVAAERSSQQEAPRRGSRAQRQTSWIRGLMGGRMA
jgi:hypothetical protein